MSSDRVSVLISILKGVLVAAAATLVSMLLIALLTLFSRISDGMLTVLNQLLKLLSILLGTRISVGRGGSRGFVIGAVTAAIYMIVGYVLYVFLGGFYDTVAMLGEVLMGATVGAVFGAILANMRPKRRRIK